MKDFKPQLVKHLHKELEKVKPNINHDYMVTTKEDGWFVSIPYTVKDGWGNVTSRAGRPIPSMRYLTPILHSFLGKPVEDLIVIAEAVIPNTPFHILNGVFNRSTGDCDAEEVEFIIHDMLQAASHTALTRFNAISSYLLLTGIFSRTKLLHVSSSPELWNKVYQEVISKGGEGIVLKQTDGLYCSGKRNSSLMKIKEAVTIDLLCIDLYGTVGEKGGDNLNMVLEDSKGNLTTVRVGKLEEAALYRDMPEEAIGHVFEIHAMKELEGGKYREPRLYCRRDDKTKKEVD